ncbi:hypothetical protein [Legionella oakridgensis]|uniref:Capsular polysaccharide assembling protein CapF C-terminal domain-containing protein n=2 Tax=Legionella oakridgensis TaxID=29423 RepID=W0BES4_9GAMM|nr:hypothetical protein [Legionella oakridgensis]AHE67132.1 hypothetical protein Loa_01584 [Legionella oakridgensis ATCC 33761 = DSM 21215]ETO93231.1 hypothetical protein LOR_18c01620 [Legionella oakridgensis RV-2-2007]KTD38058.1 hypothetical protein Loak_1734 [Legionella oakridgensis]STY20219.1 Uncharacterised protein [Legionella longbeachae]
MSNKELVRIKKFDVVGHDERGLTAEFSLPRKQAEFVFLTRKEKSVSGNTYHEGKNTATNPKVFVLLSGDITFSYRKIGTTEKYSEFIQAPAVIEVSPHVTHKVEALCDFILLECNSIKDIQNDRIREEV